MIKHRSCASLSDFLDAGVVGNSKTTWDLILDVVVAPYCWSIWQFRNSLTLGNKGNPISIIVSEVMSNSFL